MHISWSVSLVPTLPPPIRRRRVNPPRNTSIPSLWPVPARSLDHMGLQPIMRDIMHDIKSSRDGYYPQGASKKGSVAGKGKSKGQGKNRNGHGRAPGESSNASMSQAGMRPLKPMPPSTRPCLKCGSPDHESGKCPKNQHRHMP